MVNSEMWNHLEPYGYAKFFSARVRGTCLIHCIALFRQRANGRYVRSLIVLVYFSEMRIALIVLKSYPTWRRRPAKAIVFVVKTIKKSILWVSFRLMKTPVYSPVLKCIFFVLSTLNNRLCLFWLILFVFSTKIQRKVCGCDKLNYLANRFLMNRIVDIQSSWPVHILSHGWHMRRLRWDRLCEENFFLYVLNI